MAHPKPTKLRIHRKQSGFTQKEIAFLLGMRVHSLVSRHESLKREPDLRIAFAYQLLYSTSAHDLFPSIFVEVKAEVSRRAEKLISSTRLTGRNCKKRDSLAALAKAKLVLHPRV